MGCSAKPAIKMIIVMTESCCNFESACVLAVMV